MIENIKNKNIYKIKYLMNEIKSEMNYEMKIKLMYWILGGWYWFLDLFDFSRFLAWSSWFFIKVIENIKNKKN